MTPRRLHSNILHWYKRHERPLPWRRTKDPYRILLSEVMAQQTQVSRVAIFYSAWLKEFPNWRSLAKASSGTVLRKWSGLGYNNRALRLHALARTVMEKYVGSLPKSIEELSELPGIGRYTAHAVACFAFGAHVSLVDINIRRVLTRIFSPVRSASELKNEKEAWRLADSLLPRRSASTWNQALMDLGAQVCVARKPHCSDCPVKSECASAFSSAFEKKELPERKQEPSFKGIPRRIYRGRILKALHDRPLTSRQIGLRIVRGFHPHDLRWIDGILKKMEIDSLITIEGSGIRKKVSIAR